MGTSCASSCQRDRHSNTLTEIYLNTDQFSAFHPEHGRSKSLPLTTALNKAGCLPVGNITILGVHWSSDIPVSHSSGLATVAGLSLLVPTEFATCEQTVTSRQDSLSLTRNVQLVVESGRDWKKLGRIMRNK